jgi:hypothetical protein
MIGQMTWTTKAIVKENYMIHNFFKYGGLGIIMYGFISGIFLPLHFTLMVTTITVTMGVILFLIALIIGDLFDDYR